MPCSSSFLTFHMVTSAVGELEMMMMGLFDLAFFAPLGCSVPLALRLCKERETYVLYIPYAGCEDDCAVLLVGPESESRRALIFSFMTFLRKGSKFCMVSYSQGTRGWQGSCSGRKLHLH